MTTMMLTEIKAVPCDDPFYPDYTLTTVLAVGNKDALLRRAQELVEAKLTEASQDEWLEFDKDSVELSSLFFENEDGSVEYILPSEALEYNSSVSYRISAVELLS